MVAGTRDGTGHSADVFIARLTNNPSDREAYLALHAHYRSRHDFASLTNLVAGLAAYSGDTPQAAPLFVEAAVLAEQRLNDAERAEAYLRKALQLQPNHVQASEALQALLERAQRWGELSELIDEQLRLLEAHGGSAQDRAVLQYRLGELFGKQFERPDLALSHYRNAYELDPRLVRAFYEARQLHLQRGDVRAACLLYEKEVAAEPDPARRIGLLKELSERCHELSDDDGAVSALERARSLAPDDVHLTHALAGALVRRSAREDERTRALDLDRVADLLCDIAQTLDPAEARPFLVAALNHAPWHARALYELEQATPAAAHDSLALHWVAYLRHNPDGDLAHTRRVALARAYLAAGQREDALFALEPAAKSGDLDATVLLAQLRGPAAHSGKLAVQSEAAHDVVQTLAEPSPSAAQPETPAPQPTAAKATEPAAAIRRTRAAKPAKNRVKGGAARGAEPVRGPQAADTTDATAASPEAAVAQPAERVTVPETAVLPDTVALEDRMAEPEQTVHGDATPEANEPQAPVALSVQPDAAASPAATPSAQNEHAAASLDQATPPDAASAADPASHDTALPADAEQTLATPSAHAHPPPVATAASALEAPPLAAGAEPVPAKDPESASVDFTLDAAFLESSEAEELAVSRRAFENAVAQGHQDEALALAQHILTQDVRDAAAFEFAERQYRRTRDFRARAELLLRTACSEGLELAVRKQRLRDAISLFEQKLLDPEAALRVYRVLIELEPQSDDPLRGVARLLERTAQWDALCECLEQSLRLQHDSAAQLALLRRLAELHRRERQDRSAAAEALLRLIKLDPNDRAARQSLTEDLTELKRWAELTQLLQQRIEETPGKAERVALLRQLASVFERQVDDPEAAFEAYERILELAPDDAAALTRMEEIDEAAGAHDRLLSTLNRRAERASAAQAANLLVRMATIAEADLMDQERAHAYLRQALDHAPNNAQILTALANLCERAGRYDELLQLLRERVQVEKQTKARADLERRIARLLSQRMHDQAAAAAAYARLNQLGDDLEAWLFLEQDARERQDVAGLCTALDKLANLDADPTTRRARLFERAQLLSDLGRTPEAMDALATILLDQDTQDTQARAQLDALCEAASDYRPLARVVEELLARAQEPERRAQLAEELSLLYHDRLPDDAREARALAAWCEAAPQLPTPWRRLATIYERKRRYKELLEVLDALSRLEPEPDAANAAQLAAADISWTRLKDADGALTRIVAYVHGSREPLPAALLALARKIDGLAQLSVECEAAGRYGELFALLRERIDGASDPGHKADLYRQLATALIEHEQDDDGALAAYEGLLSLGDDVEALRFVQAWAIRHDDPERLVDALSRLARSEAAPEERRDLWMERGRLLRVRLQRPEQAIEAFQQALRLDPQFWPAVDELAISCELANDHAGLAAALERKLQNDADADDPVRLLRRLTELYEGTLADDQRAVHALTRWVELDPTGPEALRRLRAHYERGGQVQELLGTLDALARYEREPAARVQATIDAAVLAEGKLSDSDGAIARLTPLVPLRDEAADRVLLAIAARAQRLPEVYELLEAAGRYHDLVEQLELAAQHETDPRKKAKWLRRAARTLHERLNDPERAAAAYEALLTLEEDAPALCFMQARALEQNRPAALADVLLRLSKLETEPSELRDRLFEYAHVQHFQLHNARLAIPALQRILNELDPSFEPALDELISAAEAAEDAAALAQGLSLALDNEHDHARAAELAERLSGLYQEQLHDDASAQRVLGGWIELEPDNMVPRRKLRALLTKHAQHAELLQCLDAIARRSPTREERIESSLAAAQLCLEPLDDLTQGFRRLSELMLSGVVPAEDALHALAVKRGKLDELCQLYEQSQRYDDLCALLRERADNEADSDARAQLHQRCARVLGNTIGDELAAAEAYREVLSLREDKEALEYLCNVARRQDDNETLNDLLTRLAAISDEQERPVLQLRRALLLRDRLEQPRAAVALLRALVEQQADLGLDAALRAQAVLELETTADECGDWSALALALEAQLQTEEEPAARRLSALRLADLYEEQLPNAPLAAHALHQACLADPQHLEARQRLRPHLERQAAWPELVAVLDSLTVLEPTQMARRTARLSAAKTSYEQLQDAAGALNRLAPLVLAGDAQAEELALTIGQHSDQGHALANLYVQRARHTTSAQDAQHCWQEAMRIYEQWLQEPSEAFEASLRLLAANPHERSHLDAVDRLGLRLHAIERLSHIYDKLVRAAPSDTERIELCLRLSQLLEEQPEGLSAALDFALQAARLATPTREADLVARVERLATKLTSHTELLWAQEQRALRTPDAAAAIDAWLSATRTADIGLLDREQANSSLRRALALTEHAPACIERVEQLAAELDAARPELGEQDARRALLRAHLELAEQAQPEFRTQLILRAARFAREALTDEATSFDVLRSGAGAAPFAEPLLDALEEAALRIGRLDALDAQLARSVERSEDPADKRRLLARRARVLSDRLQRFDQAAQAYERLLELSPDDTRAAEQLASCLRKAGRHRELLRACERRLILVPEPERKLPIMREMATIWEVDLKNRASALAIWNDVRELAPHDEEATQAVQRLAGG
jgi:tetratricopeptide (TPR) repeat protein